METKVSGDLTVEFSPTAGVQLGHSTESLFCCIRAHLISMLSCVLSAIYLPLGLLCEWDSVFLSVYDSSVFVPSSMTLAMGPLPSLAPCIAS